MSNAIPSRRLALLVDGENLSAEFGKAISAFATARGEVRVQRVYGSESQVRSWETQKGYRVVPTQIGRNCADVALAVDAMELAADGTVDGVVIGSTDSDFGHLVQRLQARGVLAFGVGYANARRDFQEAFQEFLPLHREATKMEISPIDLNIGSLIHAHGTDGQLLVSDLTAHMGRVHDMLPRNSGYKKWSSYMRSKPSLYVVGKGKAGAWGRILVSREELSVLPIGDMPCVDEADMRELDHAEIISAMREVLELSGSKSGILLSRFAQFMAQRHKVKKDRIPLKSWKKFVESIPDVVRVGGEPSKERLFLANAGHQPQSSQKARQNLSSEDITEAIRSVVQNHGARGRITLSQLSSLMDSEHAIRRQDLPEKKWYDYLAARPHLYHLGPKGPDTKMRIDNAAL